ncbi:MAG: histone deacetylase family protein [Candidatus Aenigmarchaeota archaeon]|nr:histone deacetylase family protein [Candidatus Aenigmarchaeota archaeon]
MHPENKKRIECLGELTETKTESGEKFLEIIHKKEYIEHVKESCVKKEHLDPDTITSAGSYKAAIHAVGATVLASQTNNFAVVRPPGHHAHPGKSSGFCIFNNIAIATQKLVNEGKKVLIFDFDGHLGDGTMNIFYDTDKVLYWSLHQFPAFPFRGNVNEIGEGRGRGYTVNNPLPPRSGDDIFMEAIERFMPAAEQFKPDVVGVSAGFDAHQLDLLLDLRVSATAYYKIGEILRKRFKNVFATLEGGYNIEMLPKCLFNFMNGINDKKIYYNEQATDSRIIAIDEFQARMSAVEKNLSEYWKI